MNKQKIINEYLKQFKTDTECCKEPYIYNVYQDKDGNYNLDNREICFNCLNHH